MTGASQLSGRDVTQATDRRARQDGEMKGDTGLSSARSG